MERTLLGHPFLYKLPLIRYESQLLSDARKNLLKLLARSLNIPDAMRADIIECGIARGGTTAIMSNYLKDKGHPNHIFACDSFCGFDQQELAKEQALGRTRATKDAFTKNSYEYVSAKMKALYCSNVTVVKGFFEDTLPSLVEHKQFCFAFIDCDLADSMAFAMNQVWPHLLPNGIMLCDDYNSGGGRASIMQFLGQHADETTEHASIANMYYINKD